MNGESFEIDLPNVVMLERVDGGRVAALGWLTDGDAAPSAPAESTPSERGARRPCPVRVRRG